MLCRCISNYHQCDTVQPPDLVVLPTVRCLRSWPCGVEFNKEVCMNTERVKDA